jgi:hypothetical protein
LKDRLAATNPTASARNWLFYPTWGGLALAVAILTLIPFLGGLLPGQPGTLATADSQSPGIYATSFYSRSAQAQVVWLNGMAPASDKPTYLDPTTVIASRPEPPPSAHDPNSL